MDTHLHSKASDGMWSPSEVVEQAKAKGLEVIALTDHDTTFGVEEAVKRGNELGVRVIPGIEIDAEYQSGDNIVKGQELLGLCIDLETMQPFVNKIANDRLSSFKSYITNFNDYIESKEFQQRNQAMKYQLRNVSPLSVEDIISEYYNQDKYKNPTPFLSKMDIIHYLMEHFGVPSAELEKATNCDRRYSYKIKKEYGFLFKNKKNKPSFYEAIEAVKNAGGKAILAHPGRSKGYKSGLTKEWEKPEEEWFSESMTQFTPYHFIRDLVDHGLDGIEIYNYSGADKSHAEAQDRINHYFKKMANKLEIMMTYGSDCHGLKYQGPLIGTFGSDKIFL